MAAKRVTGSLIVEKKQTTGPIYFLKARDPDGRQINASSDALPTGHAKRSRTHYATS